MGERKVIGLADLAEYGDRRRWAWRTLLLAATIGVLMFLAWVEAEEPDMLGIASLALIGGGLAIVASIYGGRRFDVIPGGVTRLAGAPKPIVDALIELAILRDELTHWLANDWSLEDPSDLLIRTRDWLSGLGQLPASSREWLARREAGAGSIYAALRQLLTNANPDLRRGLQRLRQAIVEFERACERDELGFDPYRGTLRHAPVGLRARTRERNQQAVEVARTLATMTNQIRMFVGALVLPAVLGLYVLERWWSQHPVHELELPELAFTLLAFCPVGMWLSTQVFEHSSRRTLARLIGADAAVTVTRARQAAWLEGLITLTLVALVLAVSLGVPIFYLHQWAEQRPFDFFLGDTLYKRLLLLLPSVTVIAIVLATTATSMLPRMAARHRAGMLDDRALRLDASLPLAVLDLIRARGELRSASLREQPDLLRTIAGGLDPTELSEELRRELDRASFDPRSARALLGPALARGGIMTRRELLALELELRAIEPALTWACYRYCAVASEST